MDNQTITLYNESGESQEYTILFTYEDEETKSNYVFYYEDESDDSPILVSKFDFEGHLFPIEDPEEWDKVEELLASYGANSTDGEICQGDCDEEDK